MQRKWRRDWDRTKANQFRSDSKIVKPKVNPFKILARCILPPVVAMGLMLTSLTSGYANPTDGQITTGAGNIAQNGSTMTITQNTGKLGINWQSFNIGAGEKVQFIQPGASSVVLNRVLGSDASSIYGQLTANGKVFLINPNGVLFAPGAQVNVGGLVASTLNISDSDFLSGNYKFTGNGGSVVNQGTITAANGGYVALLASKVQNDGVIVAQQGTVALGAGQAVTLDMNGDGLLNLAVDEAAVNASAANHNLIQADGGQVIMAASAANKLVRTVVNNTGIIRAHSLNNANGVITLDAGSGGVETSGTLDASGNSTGQTGGTVKVLGDKVTLAADAKIDVSGASGGGTALIGGNYQGQGPEHNAVTTTVNKGATINADATAQGNGGKVVVWADDTTNFYGNISAKGGLVSGNGGSAEVSGKQNLVYKGTTDLQAAYGQTGTLLLDPADYTIAVSGGDMTPDELAAALGSANVTILSSNGKVKTDGSGDINVNSAVSWNNGNTLTLSAYRDVNVTAGITGTGGGNLVLKADNTGVGTTTLGSGHGTVTIADGAAISLTGGSGNGNNVSIYYDPVSYTDTATYSTVNPIASTGSTNQIVYNPYMNKVTGNLTAYMLVNSLSDLQNIQTNMSGVYALSKDVDASATTTWNNGAGFIPIGTSAINGSTGFSGIFNGDGHVISGLYIYKPNEAVGAGLFGGTNGATIRNVGLENVNITGSYHIGSLVGEAISSNINNCYSTGTVTTIAVPGLSAGTSYSYDTVAVGGLVGFLGRNSTNGTNLICSSLTNSYSSVAVAGAGDGSRDASGKTLHSRGRAVGGLVGYLWGTDVANSYSTGQVNDVGSYAAGVGGFIGYIDSEASVSNCYTTSQVTSTSNGLASGEVAGFVGKFDTYKTSITNCYAAGTVARLGDPGQSADIYSFTATSWGSISVVSNCYWNKDTYESITPPSGGALKAVNVNYNKPGQVRQLIGRITELKTADMMNHLKYTGWDFGSTWYMIDGYTYPFLRSEYSTTIRNAHQLQLMAMDLDADYTLCNNIDLKGYTMAPYGFVPIGSGDPVNGGTPFSGTFNGNGHYISGLTINNPTTTAVGLFGYINAEASIGKVGLTGVNITGGVNNQYVGSLVGYNDGGHIFDVYSAGQVSGSENVTAIGGLVGYNKGTVAGCYTINTVSGYNNAGGVTGFNAGNITNSYFDAAGVVTGLGGGTYSGGLAGANSGTITTSYSAGLVSAPGGGTSGALVGTNGDHGTISSSVWDKETSGQANGVGDNPAATGITGLATAAMDEAVNYGGDWDLTGTWSLVNGSRPVLRWEYQGSNVITSLNQLRLISTDLSGVYILGANIDLAGVWNPLGSADNPFTGILKGSGYTLSGLNIENSSAAAIGLFGYTQGAGISGVNLTGVNIIANANNLYVGSLVGYSGGGSNVTNSTAAGTIRGIDSARAGGLVGYNDAGSTIENCTSAVSISGTGSIGGLAGVNAGSIISSYNTGVVGGTGRIGGLTGENPGSISYSYNTGAVSATGADSKVGGLAGVNAGNITYSYSNAAITADADNSEVGGLVGENSGNINYAYRTGTVTANGAGSKIGGLAGKNSGGIAYAYSIGTVNSDGIDSKAGGVVGENTGNINYAYSVGATTAANTGSSAGGVAGLNGDSGTIANTNWDTETSGQASAVGTGSTVGVQNVKGLATADMMKKNYYANWDLTGTWGMIDGISFPYLKALYVGTPQFVSGRVQNGGTGKTVNLVYKGQAIGQAATIGNNGFYYLTVSPDSTVPDNSVLLAYVSGDSAFKANSAYLYENGGGLANVDLLKSALIVNGGSSTVTNDDLNITKGSLTSNDIIFTTNTHPYTDSYPGSQDPEYSRLPCTLLTVNGDLVADHYSPGNGNIQTTGAITITNPGDFYINSHKWSSAIESNSGAYNDQQFIAGGDITINCGGNFVMYYGVDLIKDGGEALFIPNEKPRLIAGGNITINCGGYFVNKTGVTRWVSDEVDNGKNRYYNYFGISSTYYKKTTSSANAFQLTGNGRWLVTAKDKLIYSTSDNEALYYDVRDSSNYWFNVAQKQRYITQSDEMILDSAGELSYDFALWGNDGQSVPATGNGFIYTSASPLSRQLTARQLMRQEAIGITRSDNACRLEAIGSFDAISGLGSDAIPFLTVIGAGVAQTPDTDKLN